MTAPTFVWSETRDAAIVKFAGQTPSAELEQRILEAFQRGPVAVISEIERVAAKLAAGKVASAWPILALNVAERESRPDATVSDESEQVRKVRVAETWIRMAGIYLAAADELLAELFRAPEWTATLAELQAVEVETRGHDGRGMYGQLLEASIRRTEELGVERVPESGGMLADFDTPALRQRMLDLWERERPRAVLAEATAERVAAERVLLGATS